MGQLLRDIVSETMPVAGVKGLNLLADIPALPLVWGEEKRLKQVITNLISNALKFTSRGSITLSASRINSDYVLVQVKDTGRGIDKEEMSNLFDPYRRIRGTGPSLGGLGIGCSLQNNSRVTSRQYLGR
jgi:two-component system CheB/CheR fusion protein